MSDARRAAGSDPPPSAGSLGAPAAVLGGARLTARLGEGSLAEVFRAVQPELGRAVAVKVLKGSISPESQLARRFAHEGALLARVAHENLPQVYAAGEVDGRPFLVLELIEGVTLARALELGALPVDAALVVGLGLARALDELHRAGLVHRDLKPANVLLSHRGDVKLVDLGVARVLGDADDGLGVVGTPAYMSPEQVLGDALDPRSDLFSLGVVLYEALTARRPFAEEGARTVMQKIRLDRYVPPRRLRREIPDGLERVLGRCLEKTPAHRYGSAAAVASDLAELLARRGVAAHRSALALHLARVGLTPAERLQRAVAEGEPWAAGLAVAADEGARDRAASAARRSSSRGWLASVREADARAPAHRARARGALGVASLRDDAARALTSALPGGRWLAGGQLALGALLAVVLASAEASRRAGGEPLERGPRARSAAGETGALRVVARPWASVSVDGVLVDTTPFAQPLRLAAGEHFVRLAHPTLGRADRAVRIERGATAWLEVDLEGPGEGASPPSSSPDDREPASDASAAAATSDDAGVASPRAATPEGAP